MQRHDTPDTATESGLSTDDLAQPRDRAPQDTPDPRDDVPTFPGESTATASDSPGREDAGRDDTGRDAGSGDADRGTSADADRGTSADADRAPDEGADTDARAAGSDARSDAQDDDDTPQLLSTQDEEGFRARWQEVQSKFVDDPREAVHTADALVADVMQRLAATFADHKQELETQWNQGGQADTEDLRLALRHYRSFFNRLLVT